MGSSLALTVLRVLSTISSVILRISPFPDYFALYKRGDVGEVALLPVVSLFVNCSTVVMYACIIEDYVPILATNALGVVTAIGFIAIYYQCTTDRGYVWKMCLLGLLIIAIVLVFTLLASTGVTSQSRHGEGIVLGWFVVVTSIVMFGSPLATIVKVVRTKSNASLPLMFCVMNFLNGALWTGYSTVLWNPFIFAPSVAATVFGVMQVTLWLLYRSPVQLQQSASKSEGTSDDSEELISVGIDNATQHQNPAGAFAKALTPKSHKLSSS